MKFKTLIACLFTSWFTPAMAANKAPEPKVYWQKDGKGNIQFYADNQNVIPHWVEVKLSNISNFRPSQSPPFTFVVGANSKKVPLFNLAGNPNQGYNLQISTLTLPGKGPATRHEDQHLYLLPFQHGKKYQVGQPYFGTATHQKPNPYALDFSMDKGSMITAARSGTVAEVKQDSNIGGPSPRYAKHANYITIYHDDGTFASYVHLIRNGALVRPGDRVRAGDRVGLSGNTGQSSGPHLHFEVFKYNAAGQSRNLPVRFAGHDKKPLSNLKQGHYYYATHPGWPSFEVELGTSVKTSDFKQSSKLPFSDKFDITTKTIDDTVVLFASNGKKSTMDIELDLKLTNFSSSLSSPIKASIPPLTEQFLTLLKPVDPAKPGQYGYTIKQQVIGKAIDDSQYANHKKRVRHNNQMKVNQKQIDDKILLFASNGYNSAKELTVTLKLDNMAPSKGRKMTVTIPALTEVYLQHVKLIDSGKKAGLGYSLRFVK